MSDTDVEIPFEELEQCDWCGKIGAFDFMGDFCCAECLAKIFAPIDGLDDFDDNNEEE